MSEESTPEGTKEIIDSEIGLSEILDEISGLPIPEPIKKNFWKAFGQLCTAVVEVPVAYLKGKTAELCAESEARLKIITSTGGQIEKQIQVDPKYAQIASDKFAQRIVRNQANLDAITKGAAQKFLADAKTINECGAEESDAEKELDVDWLNAFEREAGQKSSEEMQALFSRILAGEIIKPKSFSLKTLRTLGELDADIAFLFKCLCSLSISQGPPLQPIWHVMVPTLEGRAEENGLAKFGINYASLLKLFEYGLISSLQETGRDYGAVKIGVKETELPPLFSHNGFYYVLERQEGNANEKIRLSGVNFSIVGIQLLPIVPLTQNENYTSGLFQLFQNQKFNMRRITEWQQGKNKALYINWE